MDASAVGLGIECGVSLQPGRTCDIALPASRGELRLRATVVRCRATMVEASKGDRRLMYRAGLELEGVRDEEADALRAGFSADGTLTLLPQETSRPPHTARK